MKSIWKTKQKFEIKITGKNIFMIIFKEEDDLEFILSRHLWFFQK